MVQKVIQTQVFCGLVYYYGLFPAQIVTAPCGQLRRNIAVGIPHSGAHQPPISDALACAVGVIAVKKGR